MAASTGTDKEITSTVIEGYVGALLPEQLSLAKSGVVRIDPNPGFSATADGGNTYIIKGRVYDSTADVVPVANTDLTVTALSSYQQIGVVLRRFKVYGNEDAASLAGGENKGEWMADAGMVIAHNAALNVETRLLQSVIPAVFGSTGPLYATQTVDNSGTAFDYTMFAQGMAKMGENGNAMNAVIMHSAVFWGAQVNTMLTAQPDYASIDAYRALGVQFMGMIGNKRVFINDRCYNTGGVYDTILAGPGALYYGVQLASSVTTFRDELKAGGTDYIKHAHAYSLAVAGVSFTGTAPTGIEGVSEAALGTATNWSLIDGHVAAHSPIVVIKSLAN